jgi:hypothetical protein
LRLTDKIEKADAKRIELLAEFARANGKTFDEIVTELGI